ncbi:Sister-chromatid cohesion protein 3, partial [Linum perenne]
GKTRNGNGGKNQETTVRASDDGASHDERDDDFEELRPRPKRNRTTEGSSAAHLQSNYSLIEAVMGDGKRIPQVAKSWVERYEKDPKPALAELLTMLFEACGAKYHIEKDLVDETDVDEVVVALVNLARQGEVEDHQSLKRKDFRNFRDNLVFFWDNLVVECQNGPLFDKVLFDKCMDYIIAMSCTPPRVYRQVASLMGLQLVTSYITVAKVLGSQRETTQRQLNAEMKKRTEGPRVESLNKRLSTTHDNIVMLEEMMRKIFTGLFVHRYRDIDPNIRMSCIESLGVWILSYPSHFLRDSYLKYLGWTLNDKNAGVRKTSILALQNLYDVDDNVPTLSLFSERFSNRMIELADDIDVPVAVCAIGLVKQLLRHQLLPEDDLGPLYDLLIDDPPEIRHAIGELVYDHLIAQKFNSSQSGIRGSDKVSSEVHLSRLLQILREFSTDPILSVYVIDDLWEYMKAMKDWKCIISMLLDENPRIEITDDDATNLVRLLFASIRKAVGERIVPSSDNRKQYYNRGQRELFESSKRDITVAMMKNYPLLLRKFVAEKSKIPSLVETILYMNLELYSLKRQEQNFRSVLLLIKEAFFKHGEREALRSCVKALNFCTIESKGELKDFSCSQLKYLEDELIAKLKSALKEAADGDEYSLLVNLKRLYELQLLKTVPLESLFEDFVSTLHKFRTEDDEVASFLLLNMYLHVAWSLQAVVNSETISEEALSSLLMKRDTLFKELEYFVSSQSDDEGHNYKGQLACRVCIILAEAWCLFRLKSFSSSQLESLGYCPDISFLNGFWKLCEKQLKVADVTEDERVNNEYIEETNRDAIIIAAAKLVATDTVSNEYLCPQIISHFVMHGTGFTDVIKHLITVIKKRGDDIPMIFLEALKMAYGRHMLDVSRTDDELVTSKSFQDCKDLAGRISGSFAGAARNKHRSDILKIVKDGIDYAFLDAPKQLSFLESVVLHFVSKLPVSDILEIFKDVEHRTENVNTDEDPSGWRPYDTFVNSLQEKYAKNEGFQETEERAGNAVKRRGRPRKRRNMGGKRLFDEESSSEEDLISESDKEGERQQDEEDEDVPLSALRVPNRGVSRASGMNPTFEVEAAASEYMAKVGRFVLTNYYYWFLAGVTR